MSTFMDKMKALAKGDKKTIVLAEGEERRTVQAADAVLREGFANVILLGNEAKILYAMVLRRAGLSRKNGWADEYDRVYLYYPINEVTTLLHCGRQKAVDTLRELQYAGLLEIRKQGCGKPNRIYPKWHEAVPDADFKKSGHGTPED